MTPIYVFFFPEKLSNPHKWISFLKELKQETLQHISSLSRKWMNYPNYHKSFLIEWILYQLIWHEISYHLQHVLVWFGSPLPIFLLGSPPIIEVFTLQPSDIDPTCAAKNAKLWAKRASCQCTPATWQGCLVVTEIKSRHPNDLKHDTTWYGIPVDGRNPAFTSWGKGSLSHY